MKNFSGDQLISQLKNLVSDEISVTAHIIEHLREVESRKLYLEMAYSSLYEFCIKELRYSEGSAHRRISAMRLIRDLPEIKAKMMSGELSLSVLSQAQSFFTKQKRKAQPYSDEKKRDVLKLVDNFSSRECEKTLLKLDPESIKSDRQRRLTETLTELKLMVDDKFLNKAEQIKNRYSHTKPNATTKEILELSMDEVLREKNTKRKNLNAPLPSAPKGRHISASLRDAVWEKSGNQCSFVHEKTGRRCQSRKFLEIDHIKPFSKGGVTELDNLQLLCDAHNNLKSDSFIESAI